MITRRTFLQGSLLLGGIAVGVPLLAGDDEATVMTVRGPIAANALGNTLIHEHILVDFSGADAYDRGRWIEADVIKKVLPYLEELKAAGCDTFVDCTPNYLGRDVNLLFKLSELSGLNIITNTAYYGGSDEKYLPAHALTESAETLANRWIAEWQVGIGGTVIKPGFMKISVNPGALSQQSQKLVQAAAKTHLRTGLTLASHTGPAVAAFEEIEILRKEGVAPDAFIWVHAQSERDRDAFRKAARAGAWVSLDGLSDGNIAEYVTMLNEQRHEDCLHRTLVSHDAGWYEPGKGDGGNFRGFTTLFKKLLPALTVAGFTSDDIDQLLRKNPGAALGVRVRKLG